MKEDRANLHHYRDGAILILKKKSAILNFYIPLLGGRVGVENSCREMNGVRMIQDFSRGISNNSFLRYILFTVNYMENLEFEIPLKMELAHSWWPSLQIFGATHDDRRTYFYLTIVSRKISVPTRERQKLYCPRLNASGCVLPSVISINRLGSTAPMSAARAVNMFTTR